MASLCVLKIFHYNVLTHLMEFPTYMPELKYGKCYSEDLMGVDLIQEVSRIGE